MFKQPYDHFTNHQRSSNISHTIRKIKMEENKLKNKIECHSLFAKHNICSGRVMTTYMRNKDGPKQC